MLEYLVKKILLKEINDSKFVPTISHLFINYAPITQSHSTGFPSSNICRNYYRSFL